MSERARVAIEKLTEAKADAVDSLRLAHARIAAQRTEMEQLRGRSGSSERAGAWSGGGVGWGGGEVREIGVGAGRGGGEARARCPDSSRPLAAATSPSPLHPPPALTEMEEELRTLAECEASAKAWDARIASYDQMLESIQAAQDQRAVIDSLLSAPAPPASGGSVSAPAPASAPARAPSPAPAPAAQRRAARPAPAPRQHDSDSDSDAAWSEESDSGSEGGGGGSRGRRGSVGSTGSAGNGFYTGLDKSGRKFDAAAVLASLPPSPDDRWLAIYALAGFVGSMALGVALPPLGVHQVRVWQARVRGLGLGGGRGGAVDPVPPHLRARSASRRRLLGEPASSNAPPPPHPPPPTSPLRPLSWAAAWGRSSSMCSP